MPMEVKKTCLSPSDTAHIIVVSYLLNQSPTATPCGISVEEQDLSHLVECLSFRVGHSRDKDGDRNTKKTL